jgi:hypothetical protein
MGLLDDAIREHLELKRLRGVDPGEVAREEQDALGPVRHEGEMGHDGEKSTDIAVPTGAGRLPSVEAKPAPVVGSSSTGQETIEINMETELAAEGDSGHEPDTERPERAAPVVHPDKPSATEESLEWEVPDERLDNLAASVGSDGRGDPSADGDLEAGEHVEDVLEETPDFLRDTPEQERLWFEQRPPRDFDFNE